jgi:TRAP-type C4-dicarboxylate transport system substrate-binding protein
MVGRTVLKPLACLAVALSVLLLSTPASKTATAAEIQFKGIASWAQPFLYSRPIIWLQEMIDRDLEGKLKLKYLGSAEVVPAFEQMEALRNGVTDVLLTSHSYYTGQMPVAQAGLFVNTSAADRRKSGYYDLLRKLHMDDLNIVYLASIGGPVGGFRFYLRNKKVTKPDFTGLKLRGSKAYTSMVKALGGTLVIMKPTDAYSALERGVVDGLGWGRAGFTQFAFHEVTKYVVNHPFQMVDTGIFINGDSWRKLPADVRNHVEKLGVELEQKTDRVFTSEYATEDDKLRKAGMEFLTFSAKDAQYFTQLAHNAGWTDIIKIDPVNGPKLKAMGYK